MISWSQGLVVKVLFCKVILVFCDGRIGGQGGWRQKKTVQSPNKIGYQEKVRVVKKWVRPLFIYLFIILYFLYFFIPVGQV